MLARTFLSVLLAAAFILPLAVCAQEETPAPPVQEEWLLYGSPLMSLRERAEYRARLRQARTPEQQEEVRRAYYGQMQERARLRGITLPGTPAAPAPPGGTAGGRGTERSPAGPDLPPASDVLPEVPAAEAPAGERRNGPVPGGTVPGGPVPGGGVPGGEVPGGPVPGGTTSERTPPAGTGGETGR